MKIRNRLYYGFGSIFILVICFSVFMMHMLNELNRDAVEIVNSRYEKLRLISVVRYELNNMGRELRGLPLTTNNSQSFADSVNLVEKYRVNALVTLDALDTLATDDKAKQTLAKVRINFRVYERIGESIIAAVRTNMRQQEVQPLLYDGARVRGEVIQGLDELQNSEELAIQEDLRHSQQIHATAVRSIYASIFVSLFIGLGITLWVVESIAGNINKVTGAIASVSSGAATRLPRIDVAVKDEIGDIAATFNKMADVLERHAKQEQEQKWLKTKIAEVATMCQGVEDLDTLARYVIGQLTAMVGASYGVLYLKEEREGQPYLSKAASYAEDSSNGFTAGFRFGEGLVGQCAVEKQMIILRSVPETYIKISSGTGQAVPASIIIVPVEFEDEVSGVIELAAFETFGAIQQTLLTEVATHLGISINSIASRMKVERLLQESQVLTEELQEKSAELQTQQEELQAQQQELLAVNEQLAEQYNELERKNRELEKNKATLEEQARQLALNSKYKSEFLANMSHELRTPLNSLLILAQILAENRSGNLTDKQVEYANTICSSGNDLLNLINDILDLSKIESGRMDVSIGEISLDGLLNAITGQFMPLARRKGIEFIAELAEEVPKAIYTDEQRLRQILKNLLSNAFKFTERGSVRLTVRKAECELITSNTGGKSVESVIAISVTDTGIGIPEDKQDIIFKAFRQADGTTNRKYGGTGLGLTISRDIARLLGGFIEVKSVVGLGSTFTLYLPNYARPSIDIAVSEAATLVDEATDEMAGQSSSQELLAGKKILIVDDDMRNVFALTTALENQQMTVLFAENGREGIKILQTTPNIDLVLMDIMMPEMDGFEAIQMIRQIPEFQDIPIIALTAKAMKNDREQCLEAGASDYISKPINLEQLLSLMRVWLY